MENLQQHNPDNPCPQKSVSDRKFVIFDLDGTLIDSFECVLRCVNKALDSFSLSHVDIPLSERHGDIALIFDKAQKIITGKMNFSDFKKRFDEIHLDDCIASIRIKPLAYVEFIKHTNDGCNIIILTNKLQPIAEKICRHFFGKMSLKIIGRKTVNPFKHNFLSVIQEFKSEKININNCIYYYGDSNIDSELADNLKIKFIHV